MPSHVCDYAYQIWLILQGVPPLVFLALMKQAVMVEGSCGRKLMASRNWEKLATNNLQGHPTDSQQENEASVLRPQEMSYGSDQN